MTRINCTFWKFQRVREYLEQGWRLKVIGMDVFLQRECDG